MCVEQRVQVYLLLHVWHFGSGEYQHMRRACSLSHSYIRKHVLTMFQRGLVSGGRSTDVLDLRIVSATALTDRIGHAALLVFLHAPLDFVFQVALMAPRAAASTTTRAP